MNTDVEIFNKALANLIQHYIKKIIHHDEVGFIPRTQGWFNIFKLINKSYQQHEEYNHVIILIDTE